MWREYYKKGTAIYWQPANEEQLYDLNRFTTKRRLQKYIEEQKKLFKSITLDPMFFWP